MTIGAFHEEGTWVLGPRVFDYILSLELRRAVRSQTFLTVVTLETVREWEGMSFTPDDGTLREVAQVAGKVVRDTDLVGHWDEGTLALVLLHSNYEHSIKVIDRLVGRIENYQFMNTLRMTIGAASFPAHAVDVTSLKRHATARPLVNLRRAAGPAPGHDAPSTDQN